MIFFLINTCIQQQCIKLINNDTKIFIKLEKFVTHQILKYEAAQRFSTLIIIRNVS